MVDLIPLQNVCSICLCVWFIADLVGLSFDWFVELVWFVVYFIVVDVNTWFDFTLVELQYECLYYLDF